MAELNPIEWAVRPLKKYAVFSGRAPRAEYWWYTLATMIVGFPIDFIDKIAGNTNLISGAFNLALILPSLAVTVRRLHDIDRSGWWLLPFVVPFVVMGVAVAAGTGGNVAALDAAPLGWAAGIVMMIIALVWLAVAGITMLVFTVTSGTEGPNRYGPDPYGPDSLEEVFA